MASNGYFFINVQTKNGSATKAESLALDVIHNWLKVGPTTQEMLLAKNNLIGRWPIGVSTNADIANYLPIVGFYNLPLDWIDTFIDKIKAVSSSDIKSAFNDLIDMNKLLIVRVGDS